MTQSKGRLSFDKARRDFAPYLHEGTWRDINERETLAPRE